MVLDPTDPTVVTSLSILIQGDDAPTKTLTEVRQPDNVETTANGLYITEDPGIEPAVRSRRPSGQERPRVAVQPDLERAHPGTSK